MFISLEFVLIDLPSLFSREAAPLLGIDVSVSSVVVELGRNRAGAWCLSVVPWSRWSAVGSQMAISKFDEVAEAVRRAVRKCGGRTKNAAFALPASAVITKKIILPSGLSDEEMEIQVESEANQYIPFSLDEVAWTLCDRCERSVGGDVDVLIAASRKEKRCKTGRVWPKRLD